MNAPPCTCACCAHKVIGLGHGWCGSKTHPSAPQSVSELLRVKSCDHWSEESDQAPPAPGWFVQLIDSLQRS